MIWVALVPMIIIGFMVAATLGMLIIESSKKEPDNTFRFAFVVMLIVFMILEYVFYEIAKNPELIV